ncbi:uncharacterized protein [Primulina eburnea]|uniref:uncharacterized protein n=1 Tax=Primulina eburnea TaxID=1245227 RepID=UPI003C6C1838
MIDFSTALEDCGLQDLFCKGDKFTWSNRRKGDDAIFARLDRFVCNLDWRRRFPTASVENLDYFGSDHRPISLTLVPRAHRIIKKYPRRFTFEHKWLLEDDFTQTFKLNWDKSRALTFSAK